LIILKKIYVDSPDSLPGLTWLDFKSVFGSMIAGVFQIIFRAKMHANDFFLFFKNHF
jgi:hypothetical protein